MKSQLGDSSSILTCWLVAMVNVVIGMAIGTACIACWFATETLFVSGMGWQTGATSGLHWIVPGDMMVANVGLDAGRRGRPPYSGFSCGGRAMSMWSARRGAGVAVRVGGFWIINVSVVCVVCCCKLLILFSVTVVELHNCSDSVCWYT